MRVATVAMRCMPPKITIDTIAPITMPSIKCVAKPVSTPSGARHTWHIDSVSWLACISTRHPTKVAALKRMASGFMRGEMPLVSTCMGPPCTTPLASLPLYIIASVPSKNFVAIPRNALTHIQKIAPGPPTHSAIATPAILPMPTVELIVVIKAWNELMLPSPRCFM